MSSGPIRVAINFRVGRLLREFSRDTGETAIRTLEEAVLDYTKLIEYIRSGDPDNELKRLFLSTEMKSQVVLDRIEAMHKEYLELKNEDALLLGIKPPKRDNSNYSVFPIPRFLYENIKQLIKRNPNLYNNRTATVKDVVDRAVLFRIIRNEDLIDNDMYRGWRAEILFQREINAKMRLEDIIEKVSVRKKVKLKKEDHE